LLRDGVEDRPLRQSIIIKNS